ncbi:MAG TPA: VOC family protein [Methanomicrobia archaeon]|nr:VOC family protein [Methanomicrobia archaeon]
MPKIVHFDLPADDLERARKFYTGLFGWTFEKLPMDYFLITTSDEKGSLGGGMGKRGDPEQGITNFIGVEGIEDYMRRVEKAGGSVISPKQTVPGWGHMALCADTEGNVFGLFEEDASAT